MNIFKSCAIGRSSDEEGAPETWNAFANDSHHEISKHSCVSLVGNRFGRLQTWYGRVQAFLSFTCVTRDHVEKGY